MLVIIIIHFRAFFVAFVETAYTVDESMPAVNVCVNLTQPSKDILDETVNVYVIDNSRSVYIPSGAPLASKTLPKFIRPSVDGLYRDGTVHISREMHKQCFITRREMTSRAPKPHRHRSRTFL